MENIKSTDQYGRDSVGFFPLNFLSSKVWGKNFVSDLIDEIINSWCIYFDFKNWPFKYQTKAELFSYLFHYGIVWITKIGEELMFFPVQRKSNVLISPFSIKNLKNIPNIVDQLFNLNLNKLILNDPNIEKMPFIFINQNQTSPLANLAYAFENLSDLEEIGITNRMMKIKIAIKYMNKSISPLKKLIDSISRRDPSPFFYTESDKDSILNQLLGKKSDFSDNIGDYSNTILNERNYFKRDIKVRNGVFNSIKYNKSSAQETDFQTIDTDIDTINNLRIIDVSLIESFKKINSIFNKKIKVKFSNYIQQRIDLFDSQLNNAIKKSSEIEEDKGGNDDDQAS